MADELVVTVVVVDTVVDMPITAEGCEYGVKSNFRIAGP